MDPTPRRLTPIEIAEGALLADIAIALELLSIYLPYLSLFARLLIPIVFALLALRRGLYVGLMGLSVAMFVVMVMTGIHYLMTVGFLAGTGLFLGSTMKNRWPHPAVLLLGVTSAALLSWGLTLLLTVMAGVPLDTLGQWFQKSYETVISVVNLLASHTPFAYWWREIAFPWIDAVARVMLTYWWATYLALIWLLYWPVVTAVYLAANVMVRLMGYPVNPFPGGRIELGARRLSRRLAREGLRRGFLRGRRTAS